MNTINAKLLLLFPSDLLPRLQGSRIPQVHAGSFDEVHQAWIARADLALYVDSNGVTKILKNRYGLNDIQYKKPLETNVSYQVTWGRPFIDWCQRTFIVSETDTGEQPDHVHCRTSEEAYRRALDLAKEMKGQLRRTTVEALGGMVDDLDFPFIPVHDIVNRDQRTAHLSQMIKSTMAKLDKDLTDPYLRNEEKNLKFAKRYGSGPVTFKTMTGRTQSKTPNTSNPPKTLDLQVKVKNPKAFKKALKSHAKKLIARLDKNLTVGTSEHGHKRNSNRVGRTGRRAK